jgi:ATP-binding cassette subfamily B protein
MNYKLKTAEQYEKKNTFVLALQRLVPLLAEEKTKVYSALFAMLVNSMATLAGPIIIAQTIDGAIKNKDFHELLIRTLMLAGVYVVALISNYIQIVTMGRVGRRVLFNLRNTLFGKLQSLPVAFFNQNTAGDIISRINSDTEKLNNFFAQALVQFLGNIFLIVGAGIFLLSLNIKLGLIALIPALCIAIITRLITPWVSRTSVKSLQTLGNLSAEVQESISNFRVIAAFNRQDYFREKFHRVNTENYKASVSAGVSSNAATPIYAFASQGAQLVVLLAGLFFIQQGQLSIGLLVAFLLYVQNFYFPLRQLAQIWSTWQLALAGLERISEVLGMKSDMEQLEDVKEHESQYLAEFKNVSFGYPDGKKVLQHVSFYLEAGKTYAFVGPTGGGKTTTASLMARLYDPTEGKIFLSGKDIKSYPAKERAIKIGFILQDPFLFTGTVRDNIVYGNAAYAEFTDDQLRELIEEEGLSALLARFEEGLDTKVISSGESVSLGQKQLIAFMRAMLRHPELLILDEATANIDTVTEQLLEDILSKLPKITTKIIIAHRLNTISNADEIFFINEGSVVMAGSMEHAVDMLMHGKKKV